MECLALARPHHLPSPYRCPRCTAPLRRSPQDHFCFGCFVSVIALDGTRGLLTEPPMRGWLGSPELVLLADLLAGPSLTSAPHTPTT